MTTEQSSTWYCARASGAYRTFCEECQTDRWHRYTGETTKLGHKYECVECWRPVIEPALETASSPSADAGASIL